MFVTGFLFMILIMLFLVYSSPSPFLKSGPFGCLSGMPHDNTGNFTQYVKWYAICTLTDPRSETMWQRIGKPKAKESLDSQNSKYKNSNSGCRGQAWELLTNFKMKQKWNSCEDLLCMLCFEVSFFVRRRYRRLCDAHGGAGWYPDNIGFNEVCVSSQ